MYVTRSTGLKSSMIQYDQNVPMGTSSRDQYGQEVHLNIHGGDIYRNPDVLDFSVNRNPLGIQKEVLDTIVQNIYGIENYPDTACEKLRKAIGRFEGVAPDVILCSNGAAELFFAVVTAIKPKRALLCAPSFSEYERALHTAGADIVYYPLREDDGFQVSDDFLDWLDAGLDLVFLCNPNNPTGQTVDQVLLRSILQKCRKNGIIVVVDECFIDFLDHPGQYTMKKELFRYPNLILVKAMTKLFSMPGLRLGYALCENPMLIQKMKGAMQPWSVSVPAQAGGIAALEHSESFLAKTREVVAQERQYLTDGLRGLGCRVYGSKANFIFFRSEKTDLYERALKYGFLIRDCSNYRGLEKGYYRAAVRQHEDNKKLLEWMSMEEKWQRKS